MNLFLRRFEFAPTFTIGRLSVNGLANCWVCEDTVRPDGVKVYGETAIPAGRYKIVIDFSNRFQCLMPHLLDVPGFEGIRIHPGNKAVNTHGCLLPGLVRLPDGVGESRDAYRPLYNSIARALNFVGEEVWIEIANERDSAE